MSLPRNLVRPVVIELTPAPEAWDVAQKLAHLPNMIFLDSAERTSVRGRYSYLTADPLLWLDQRIDDPEYFDGFDTVASWLDQGLNATLPGLPPFQGGVAGLWGYGLNRAIERISATKHDEFALPDLAVGLYDWVISFDHTTNQAWLISTGRDVPRPYPQAGFAQHRAENVMKCLNAPAAKPPKFQPTLEPLEHLAPQFALPGIANVTSNFSRQSYCEAVAKVVEYIHAGDAFQVNLSQRLLTPFIEDPLALYGRLRTRNAAPFACYFDLGDFQIASASPERFLQVEPHGTIITRPIKGTRPRGKTPEDDATQLRDLLTNPKDRAENIMIVDLLRNDIGRVAEFGTVTVPKVCEAETFPFVHHLVSEVRGKLASGKTPLDLLRNAFPGGSVTGAPKVRAMEIIAELEPTARGPYCGSVGFLSFDGATDTNILIRTFTAGRGYLQFPVGGGITSDSIPEVEYEETLHKAAGLLRALQP
jgi:para-aminobenzoate synthetase component I